MPQLRRPGASETIAGNPHPSSCFKFSSSRTGSLQSILRILSEQPQRQRVVTFREPTLRLPMAARPQSSNSDSWPELPLEAWRDTYATLHMWTQIVGKVRLALSPRVNHWWEVPLYVNARGLTTSAIPYKDGIFEVQFDFIEHKLAIETSWGASKTLP